MKSNIVASIILPTFNAEKYLDICLKSIEKQDQKKETFEVLIVDGGSTDSTLSIVRKYQKRLNMRVLENKLVDAESGKHIGIKASRGRIVILLDSDNEIVQKNWLSTGIEIIEKHNEVWGIESPWLLKKDDSYVNQYFTLLKIADPLARMLSSDFKEFEDYKNYRIYTVKSGETIVTGANGFFWRKSVIAPHLNGLQKFEEVNFVSKITKKKQTQFARLKTLGVHHYYCDSVFKYFKKRMKIANKFLRRKEQKQKTWVDDVSRKKIFFSIVYLGSFIGPLAEGIVNGIRDRNVAWLYHPIISFITIMIYTYSVVRKIFR